jgi:hypothetical protein
MLLAVLQRKLFAVFANRVHIMFSQVNVSIVSLNPVNDHLNWFYYRMFIFLDCCDSVVTHQSLVILEHASLGCDSVSTHVPIHLFWPLNMMLLWIVVLLFLPICCCGPWKRSLFSPPPPHLTTENQVLKNVWCNCLFKEKISGCV